MSAVINRVELTKPSYFKESPLLIAKMAHNKLKNLSRNTEADMISKSITGNTSLKQAYEITSKYIIWKSHYGK